MGRNTPEDLAKLPPEDPAFPLVRELIKDIIEAYTWEGHLYNPDWYGYTILIEEGDADRTTPHHSGTSRGMRHNQVTQSMQTVFQELLPRSISL